MVREAGPIAHAFPAERFYAADFDGDGQCALSILASYEK